MRGASPSPIQRPTVFSSSNAYRSSLNNSFRSSTGLAKTTSYQVSSVRDSSPGSLTGTTELTRRLSSEIARLGADHEANGELGLETHRHARVHDEVVAHAFGQHDSVPERAIELEPLRDQVPLEVGWGRDGHLRWVGSAD